MVVDVGFGYLMLPDPDANEREVEQMHRRWCERFGLDYEEMRKKVQNEPVTKCI